jgi:YVTN family beta-propeller protein
MRTRIVFLVLLTSLAILQTESSGATITRKLYVANTAGDTLSVIDLEKQVVDHEINIGKHPHGLAVSPDQRRLYCSIEPERAIKFLDTATDKILVTVPTTGVPNQLAVTPDGQWVYVAINDKGTADIISTKEMKVFRTVQIGKQPHNCYCPPNSRHMYVTSIGDHCVKQFDFAHEHVLNKTVTFDGAVRPLCVTRDEKWLFVALEGLHGFAWADLAAGKQNGTYGSTATAAGKAFEVRLYEYARPGTPARRPRALGDQFHR